MKTLMTAAITALLATTGIQAQATSGEAGPQEFEGTLRAVAAIGGETTGHALETASGDLVELDLRTEGFVEQFRDGERARVAGYFKTVRGVEIPVREVLVVTRFESLEQDNALVKFSGSFVRIAGIGGESTGYGLDTGNRIVELDLETNDFADAFRNNRRVQVRGYFKTVHGVEIPRREVLVVTAVQ